MANLRLAVLTRNAMMDAVDTLTNLGSAAATIKIYSGTQPATADTALSGNTLLATFTLDNPAFGVAASGAINLGATPIATTGVAAGTATFFRMATGGTGGAGTICDGDVGTSSTTLILNTVTISSGVAISLTSGSLAQPTGV